MILASKNVTEHFIETKIKNTNLSENNSIQLSSIHFFKCQLMVKLAIEFKGSDVKWEVRDRPG